MTSMQSPFTNPGPDPGAAPALAASSSSFLGKAHSPFLQAAVAGGLMLLMELITLPMGAFGPVGFGERLPWIIVTAFMLLFALFNSIFCLASSHSTRYWNQSVISYVLLATAGGLLAWGVSGISINDAGSFRWLFFVVSFSYLVFISIVNLMRIIVAFAMKEEWHAPRLRERKRREP